MFLKNKKSKYILYILLGIIWSLSNIGYVKYFGSFFAWFTFVPFILFMRNESIKDGIKYSVAFGFSAYLVHFWWMVMPVYIVMKDTLLSPNLVIFSALFGIVLTVCVAFLQGFYYTLVFVLSRYMACGKKILYYMSFVFVGTVLDYFFPKIWADYLGYSQYKLLNIVQAVDLFGISLITVFVLFVNSSIAYFIDCIISRKNIIWGTVCISLSVLFLFSLNLYGEKRIVEIKRLSNIAPKKMVGIIQGNISGLEKRDKRKSKEMINVYNDLSLKILDKKPDLIIWPESSIPIWFNEGEINYSFIKRFGQTPLLFGTLSTTDGMGKRGEIYNSLILLDSNGDKCGFYYKNKLLPFVEAAPHKSLNFLMSFMNLRPFTPGKDPKVLKANGINFLPNICYEAIIPEYVMRSQKIRTEKTNLLINATNDSWFGKTIEPEMHLRISSFRAIENRRYLVRSTCTGFSVIVDAVGNIIYRSKLMEKEAAAENVSLLDEDTVYSKWGWTFIYILGFLFVCVFGFVAYFKYTTKKNQSLYEYRIKHRKMLIDVWYE